MTENWQLYQMEIILLQYSKFSKDDYTELHKSWTS